MEIKKIIFEAPLYSKWENKSQKKNDELIEDLTNFDERIERYCTECLSRRIFASDKAGSSITGSFLDKNSLNKVLKKNNFLLKCFNCSANSSHKILIGFYIDDKNIVKISEYPSRYDSVRDNFNKYNKILKKDKLDELAKASQLESNGYAIAASLYYRRIFENIILRTFLDSSIPDKIDESEFRKKRMEDKIKYVKSFLPNYFNDNPSIYSILSKAVHELKEEECREYLPIVSTIIFYSLDEAVDKRNKELRKKEFAKKSKEIYSNLK